MNLAPFYGYPYRAALIKIPVLNLVLYLVLLALRSIVSVLSCVTDVGSVVAYSDCDCNKRTLLLLLLLLPAADV